MSRAEDRIPVPSNGHHPPLSAGLEPGPGDDDGAPRSGSEFAERRGAAIDATPTQLAVGFGVIASLILLLIGARRRRR